MMLDWIDAPGAGTTGPDELPSAVRPAADLIDILDEIPGVGRRRAARRPGGHRRDRAGREPVPHRRAPGVLGQAVPQAIQSGAKTAAGKTGKGNRYLEAVLGDAAAGAARTTTFLTASPEARRGGAGGS